MNYAEQIRDAMNKMQSLMDKAKKESRDLSEDEQVVFDSLEKDIEKLKTADAREKKIQAIRDGLGTVVTPSPAVDPQARNGSKWKNFGEFLMAVKNAYDPSHARVDNRLIADRASDPQNIGTGMQVGVSSDGGFMVQPTFVSKLMDSIMAKSTTMSRITMIPIGEGSNGIVMPALNETSRANGSRFGGARAYWANEGATVTATKPKIREITLKLEKLLAFCYMTEELMRDASAMESFITKVYSDEMAFVIDDAIFNGTGLGAPLGILKSPGLITVTKRGGQAADTVVFQNIIDMWSRLSPASQTRAAWFINQEVQIKD